MYKVNRRRRALLRAVGGRRHSGGGMLADLLKLALIVSILVVPIIEATSRAVTQMRLDESARVAAITASASIDTLPLTTVAAKRAYSVAASVLSEGGNDIDTPSFRAFADGSVKFTAHREAPSVLLGQLGVTRQLMITSSTVTSSATRPDQTASGRQWMAEK